LAIFTALAPAADKKDKGKKPPEPTPLERYVMEAEKNQTAPNAEPTGSLWSPHAQLSDLSMDLRAHRVNDIVTIVVREQASAVSSANVKTSRVSSANSSIINAGGITKATGPLSNLAKLSSDTELNGQGTTSRNTSLTTSLSARVTHVLPNGYL